MLGQYVNVAPILCHVCQQPVYLTPPSELSYVEFQRHVREHWQARHFDDSPICHEEGKPC